MSAKIKHLSNDSAMSVEDKFEDEGAKHKVVLQKVEKSFENVQKSMTNLSKFAHKRYKLTDGEIERIVNALRESYTDCTNIFEREATGNIGLFN